MNQTPAAILVLASSVLAYSATVRAYDPTGVILGLAALAMGIWGVIALIGASVRDREMLYGNHAVRPDLLGILDPRRRAQPSYATPVGIPVNSGVNSPVANGNAGAPVVDGPSAELQLSPEVRAQLSMASHLEGRDRAQIVEEALRQYLPRYERTNAA